MFASGGWWRARRERFPRPTRITGPLVVAGLVAGLLSISPLPASASSRAHPAVASGPAVTGVTLSPRTHGNTRTMTLDGKAVGAFKPSGTQLPTASSGSATLPAAGTGAISGTPLTAARTPSLSGAGKLTGTVAAQSLADRLGIHGLVYSVAWSGSSGTVRIGLDYKGFKDSYGGDFGSRLQLYTLPACALTTPELAKCRVRTPVSGAQNDTAADTLSGDVRVAGAAQVSSAATAEDGTSPQPVQATVLAAVSGTGEEGAATGDYAATKISPAGSWTAGGSEGDFTYDYPITVPSASSALVPTVALAYDSGSVDGRTSLTNAQASVVGDGWASPADNYITRTFIPCDDDPEGTASPDTTQDMCYDGDVLSLSLNGSTTTIVSDGGSFKLQNDDGAVLAHVTDSNKGQGTYNTDYWTITERDGTTYYFGLNELPGYASSGQTNSVDWEPVYSAHSGDPCYNATWADSVCNMAYEWHLDYVTDAHGNAMSYYYKQDTNYYGANKGASEKKYVRDSYLSEIDYGYTTKSGPYGTIPDKVSFTTAPRCVAATCDTPSSSMSASTAASEYPDVPVDLMCASGATCSSYAPSFFSTVMLTTISTEQYPLSGSTPVKVDSYALTQDFPGTGDASSGTLWLESIKHTGEDTTAGGSNSSISEPTVSFSGTDLPNRWDPYTYPGLYRWRISEVTSELGSKTDVTYEIPDTCAASTQDEPSATPSSNTTSCYPVYWTPGGYGSTPIEDWFIKYAVQEVTVTDQTGLSTEEETQYQYANPAWHYDDDPAVKAMYRTYGEFRGYQKVTTLKGNGAGDPIDKSVTAYYQGMYGDYLSATSTSTTTVTDSLGGVHDDENALAGQPLETDVYLGDSTTLDKATVYAYWVSAATASETLPGLPAVTAQMSQTAEIYTKQLTTDGGVDGWDYTETDKTYDPTTSDADFGLLQYAYEHAWTSSGTTDTDDSGTGYSRCTAYTYAPVNKTLNLVGLTLATTEVSTACSGFTEGSIPSVPHAENTLSAPGSFTQDQVVSATLDFYDQNGSFVTGGIAPQTSTPTVGDVTETATATGYGSGAFTYQMTSEKTYDDYGRVEDSFDADGDETITSYTLTDGLTTAENVENALGQSTSETLDPTRGLVLTSTDANGIVTTKQYDALGRVTAEWDDSRATSAPANYLSSYTESNTGLSGSVEEKMNDAESETGDVTVTVLDSLGRTREVQTDSPAGGMLVSDTLYNSLGQESAVYKQWWDPDATPSLELAWSSTDVDAIPNWDQYVYDGLGNQVEDESMTTDDQVYSTTYTVYSGDATTVVPPTGGAVKTTETDPLGRTSAVITYATGPALNPPSNLNTGSFSITGGQALATTYTYDGHGDAATTTDQDGQAWTSVYNLLGEVVETEDPSAGDSYMAYDANGNLTQTEDSRGDYVSYSYDKLNRKTGVFAAALDDQKPGASGNETGAWVYDDSNTAVASMKNPIGHLTTEYAYSGGQTYTAQYEGFNDLGESTEEAYTFPATLTGLSGTYYIAHTYTPYLGLPATITYVAAGNLATETDSYTYDGALELPSGQNGTNQYAESTTYDAWGHVASEIIGGATNGTTTLQDTYDAHTGDLREQTLTAGSTNANVDQTTYTYDLSGNTTSEVDERDNSASDEEAQCFQYNALDELDAAWSATDACATVPSAGDSAMVGNTLGNSSAYWESWTYNDEGNRLTQDQHSLTNSSDDQITDYTYSSAQPNTLSSTATTVDGSTTAGTSYEYDDAGDTDQRITSATGTETLDWDNQRQLAGVSSTKDGTSSYVYNADGGLLVEADSATNSTTIYLPNEQITYNSGNGATTATRYYQLTGGITAVRTGAGNDYDFELSDQHGTNDLYLDYTAQSPTWRQFDPFGNPRGTAVSWVDNRTFLDDVDDTATNLTDVGARWYDSTLGRFVSLDPVLETTDTLALGGYAYTDGNPITQADPTGDMRDCGPAAGCPMAPTAPTGGGGGGGNQGNNGNNGDSGDGGGTGTGSGGSGGCSFYGPWPVGSPCSPKNDGTVLASTNQEPSVRLCGTNFEGNLTCAGPVGNHICPTGFVFSISSCLPDTRNHSVGPCLIGRNSSGGCTGARVARALNEHIYEQLEVCLVVCASLTNQGGKVTFQLSGINWTQPSRITNVTDFFQAYGGMQWGWSAATPSDPTSGGLGGCAAYFVGGCGGADWNSDTPGNSPVYGYGSIGLGMGVDFGGQGRPYVYKQWSE